MVTVQLQTFELGDRQQSELVMPTAEGEQKMKKTMVLVLCFIMLLPLAAAIAETSGETAGHEGKGKIVVLATGGTIAGIGEEGKTAGYIPGVLTAEELLLAVPDLEKVACACR